MRSGTTTTTFDPRLLAAATFTHPHGHGHLTGEIHGGHWHLIRTTWAPLGWERLATVPLEELTRAVLHREIAAAER